MATVIIQPDPTAGLDTELNSGTATTNYGTTTTIRAYRGGTPDYGRVLIKFDLSSIPAESTILSATLAMNVDAILWSGTSYPLAVYRQKRVWVEAQATWNIYSTGNNWATAGGFGADDCEQTDIGSTTPPAAGNWAEWTLDTDAVQEWLDGDFANNGLLIKRTDESTGDGGARFFSSDYVTDTSLRPKLTVEFDPPPPYEAHQFTVEIGGVDVTDYLLKETMNIVDALGKEVDTARFTLEDWDSSLSLSGWQEVIIKDEDNVVHFGGYLREVVRRPYQGTVLQIDCRCEDYSCLFSHEGINTDYTGETDAAIIADMFSNLVAHDGFDATTNVSSSGVQDHIRFNRISLAEAMRELSARTGYDWYVDANKAIWYFDPTVGAGAADWQLSDNADGVDTFLYDEDSVQDTVDDTDIRSRIYVYGGNYESDPITQKWTADGQTQEFWLAYRPKTVTEVTVNAVVQTVGLDFVDNPNDYHCLVNYVEKVIRFYGGPPTNGHVVTCTYTYEVPVAVTRQDEPSFLHYGRYFDYTLVDRKIGSIQEAREAADALLAKYAMGVNVVQVSTHRLGLRSGEIVNFTNSLLGYNDDPFLIQSVSKTLNAAGYVVCNLTLGEHRGTIIDWMLQAQITKADDLDYREAEMLRLIIEPTGETVEISETPTVTLTLPGIYTWGADADELTWNYGTWG